MESESMYPGDVPENPRSRLVSPVLLSEKTLDAIAYDLFDLGTAKQWRSVRRLLGHIHGQARELRETLADLESWDGTPDALDIIKANIRAALAYGPSEQKESP